MPDETDDATPIDKNERTAAFHRPPWMTDQQWSDTVAAMVDKWMDTLEIESRIEAHRRAVGDR